MTVADLRQGSKMASATRTRAVPKLLVSELKDGVAAGLIAIAPGTGIRLEMERGLAEIGRGGPLHEAEHPATLLAMVEAGVGVAPLPSLAGPAADHPVLTFRKLVEPVIERAAIVPERFSEPDHSKPTPPCLTELWSRSKLRGLLVF
jgi:DNA-binding transcriptional LysR family regulator